MKNFVLLIIIFLSMPALAAAQQADPPITLSGTQQLPIGAPFAPIAQRYSLRPNYRRDGACGTAEYDYSPIAIGIMVINGRISRLSFEARFDNLPETSYVTPAGIRLGTATRQLIATYPNAQRLENPHSDRLRLFVWDSSVGRGWVFEVSPQRDRVMKITVGDRSVIYHDGCY